MCVGNRGRNTTAQGGPLLNDLYRCRGPSDGPWVPRRKQGVAMAPAQRFGAPAKDR
ncbi:MAG: hypothetical protein AMXMBFR83_07760 [Phycisphaerae bacterium]|jgi:hypothetical protein